MNDVMAAIGLAQLRKLDDMNARRRAIIAQYLEGIKGIPNIKPYVPYTLDGNEAYWFFGIRVEKEKREDLIIYLKNKGIATGVHFYPLPLQPLFKPYDNGCPVAKEIWQGFITLPSHVDLTDREIEYILNKLSNFS